MGNMTWQMGLNQPFGQNRLTDISTGRIGGFGRPRPVQGGWGGGFGSMPRPPSMGGREGGNWGNPMPPITADSTNPANPWAQSNAVARGNPQPLPFVPPSSGGSGSWGQMPGRDYTVGGAPLPPTWGGSASPPGQSNLIAALLGGMKAPPSSPGGMLPPQSSDGGFGTFIGGPDTVPQQKSGLAALLGGQGRMYPGGSSTFDETMRSFAPPRAGWRNTF